MLMQRLIKSTIIWNSQASSEGVCVCVYEWVRLFFFLFLFSPPPGLHSLCMNQQDWVFFLFPDPVEYEYVLLWAPFLPREADREYLYV